MKRVKCWMFAAIAAVGASVACLPITAQAAWGPNGQYGVPEGQGQAGNQGPMNTGGFGTGNSGMGGHRPGSSGPCWPTGNRGSSCGPYGNSGPYGNPGPYGNSGPWNSPYGTGCGPYGNSGNCGGPYVPSRPCGQCNPCECHPCECNSRPKGMPSGPYGSPSVPYGNSSSPYGGQAGSWGNQQSSPWGGYGGANTHSFRRR